MTEFIYTNSVGAKRENGTGAKQDTVSFYLRFKGSPFFDEVRDIISKKQPQTSEIYFASTIFPTTTSNSAQASTSATTSNSAQVSTSATTSNSAQASTRALHGPGLGLHVAIWAGPGPILLNSGPGLGLFSRPMQALKPWMNRAWAYM